MKTWIVVLLSALVTASPRILPLFVKGFDRLPKFIRKMMALLPLASLGALIFPFAFLDFSYAMGACALSLLTAFGVGYMKKPMLISIFAALAVCMAGVAMSGVV